MNIDAKLSKTEFKTVGSRPLRPDGVDKVTGRARYGADMNMPGQLVGLILRSPHAHATIKKIDISKAEKLSGVHAVVTSKDFPAKNISEDMLPTLENCMARKKVFYDGHAVAAVAAIDANTARAALKLIDIEYKVLKHVTDIDEALKPKAPLLHKDIFTTGVKPKPTKASNLSKVSEFGHGDVKSGFKKADVIVERTFRTEQTHQVISSRTPASPV